MIYGRRRIGKSRLITEFLKDRFDSLMNRRGLIDRHYGETEYLLFSLSGYSKWVTEKAQSDNVRLLTLKDLYKLDKI